VRCGEQSGVSFPSFLVASWSCSCFFQIALESVSLSLHPNVTIVLQHLSGDVTGDVHDRLLTGTALGELGNKRVPGIVHPPLDARALSRIGPGGLDRCYRARGVHVVCPSEREEVPIRLDPAETKHIPCSVVFERGLQGWI
jgi:hypothetical protein